MKMHGTVKVLGLPQDALAARKAWRTRAYHAALRYGSNGISTQAECLAVYRATAVMVAPLLED